MTLTSPLRRLALTLGFAVALTGGAACGGSDDADPVADGCDRLDECNALLPGISAGECVEMVEVDLQGATPSQRNDWETVMNGCLEFDSCEAFIQCVGSNGL